MERRNEVILLLLVAGLTSAFCRSVASTKKNKATAGDIVCLEPGEMIPDPNECDICWECSPGLIPQKLECISGYYFNMVTNKCEPADQVDCGTRSTIATTPTTTVPTTTANIVCVTSGEILPDPSNCAAYFQCDWDLNANREVCPDGEYFNYYSNECLPEDEVDCGTRPTISTTTVVTEDPLVIC